MAHSNTVAGLIASNATLKRENTALKAQNAAIIAAYFAAIEAMKTVLPAAVEPAAPAEMAPAAPGQRRSLPYFDPDKPDCSGSAPTDCDDEGEGGPRLCRLEG